jgi:aminoglycoside phosphotransferase family enzyme
MNQTFHPTEISSPDTEFATKLRCLSRTCAFPTPVNSVVVHQTHISAVFVGGDLALKIKKPVKLPFLDFSSIHRRRFYCDEEVRINRSWAPGVYLGVIPVTRDVNGAMFQGLGEVIDWAVKMRRLSDADNLRSRLHAGTLTRCQLIHVAHRIAGVHQNACQYHGDQAVEADEEFRRRVHENWGFARCLPTEIIDPHVLKRLETLSNDWLHRYDEELRARAQAGFIREVHGDLRLEHVFLCPDRTPPRDVLVIDGIEFYPGLRRIDVVSDIAFLVMELQFTGYRDLAREFADAYFSQTEDSTGRDLLPLRIAPLFAARLRRS